MKIEIAKMERMSQTGSSLLRLIQNDHTPILDLLIRESVQNSIDAAKKHSDWVGYDISTKEFEKTKVVSYFEGISDKLNKRYKNEKQKSIVIKDYNTTGLTGPIHQEYVENNNYGNLLKLIYEISMPQEKIGAGGSWGLGKTVYFRVGIGLVVYYSRIRQDDGTYASRLAACLVEDETKDDRLLPDQGNLRRGIAWWGQPHNDDSTKPITDENKIREILESFNVSEYQGNETGTTVIIPFIHEDKLIPKRETKRPLWWHSSVEHYISIALQRWYSPKIDNLHYPYGPYLKASVNGELIVKDKMEPLFSIINTLYTLAATDKLVKNDYLDQNMVTVEEIKLYRTLENNVAGQVAYTKVNREILRMVVPYNKRSPFEYIELEDTDDTNPPIVLYLRKPGMIVNFETDSKWTNGIDNTDKNEYIIAVFVPKSDNIVKASHINITLDEYLRQGEKADHSSWEDIILGDRQHTIVSRIQKGVSRAIREAYSESDKEEFATKSGALSKALAKLLLPPVGFGNAPGGTTKSSSRGTGGRINKIGKLQITNSELGEDNVLILDFHIKLPKNIASLDIDLQIESEGAKKFKGDEWEKESEIGVPFPVEFIGISFKDPHINHKLIKTNRYKRNSKARIYTNNQSEIIGKIYIRKSDPMIQPSLQESLVKEDQYEHTT